MPVLPNGRYLDLEACTFTPFDTNIEVAITGVQSCDVDPQGQSIAGMGDADAGPSSRHQTQTDPQATLEMQHLAILTTLPPGTKGIFTVTFRDADNGIGPGALTQTLNPAMIENTTRSSRNKQYGTGRITIRTWRPDGKTNPLRDTVAPPA